MSSFDEESVDGGVAGGDSAGGFEMERLSSLPIVAAATEIGLVIWAQRAHRILMKL